MQAAQEFSYILKRPNIPDEFDADYPLWANTIIQYCKDTQIKSTALQLETKDATGMSEGGYCTSYTSIINSISILIEKCCLTALHCLALLFIPMKTKRLDNNIPYILQVVPVS